MNGVMNGRNTYHHAGWNEGTLSIKFIVSGEGRWITEEGAFNLTGDQFLVLNKGQRYGLHIKSPMLVETFCVFFKSGFVESIWADRTARLDEPSEAPKLEFPTRLEPYDSTVLPELLAFRRLVRSGRVVERGLVEDGFIRLADVLLGHYFEVKQVEIGTSTAQETAKRLARARDYMLCNFSRDLDLEEISREAFLSPFHFHRLFKKTFGETPHRFLTRVRVEKASRLLQKGDASASQICVELGFSSYASFSHLMLRSTGKRPSAFLRETQDRTCTLP